ncbi:MAG: prefoldin subunit alpha [Euryarchaeota archaeon RBG_16_68_13]|nr:MAG: prefoldin subunit alpha [Euryarchaeota archaeon RBG_16_68_13]
MSSSETDLRRGMAILEQYRAQIESLAQQQEIVRLSLEEHLRAKETLSRYREAGKGAEVLVPVGANAFVVSEVRDPEKALIGIGSDLIVYDAIPSQIERLEARITSISEAANAIGQRLAELQRRADAQGAFVQEAYESLASKGLAEPGERE